MKLTAVFIATASRDVPIKIMHVMNTMNIDIIRKRIKNLYLNITPQGEVKVSAPMRMPLSDIHAFIELKSSWIKKQHEKFLKQEQKLEKNYNDDELHYFNGKPYKLKVIAHTAKPMIYLSDEYLFLHIHPHADRLKKQGTLEKWYGEQLKIKAHELIQHWEVKMNVFVKQVKIRGMKTRWGSCSPHSQSIRINLELAKRSIECLEYIIVHELTHLLEPSHNKRFVRLMNAFLPDWKIRRKTLRIVL